MATSTESTAEAAPAGSAQPKLVAVAGVNRTVALQEQRHDFDVLSTKTSHENGADNFFKSAIWSPDGTSVITNSDDNHISTYVIPPDLLETRSKPLVLTPYTTIPSHNSVPTFTLYPGFSLSEASTTLVLSACHQHPIRLHNICSPLTQVASYPLVNPHTEAYITPQSLLFQPDGNDFIAGADTSIANFDISRPGDEPVMWYRTGPKRSRDTSWRNPATSVKGIISTMALDRSKQHVGAGHGVLAVGSFSRQIGLYDAAGRGECVAAFSVKGTEAEEKSLYGGTGVTQVLWSSCGRYLFVVERKSDGLLVYDIRVTGKVCEYLHGRAALTNQRMSVEVAERGGRTEVWAGGTDGVLRCWHNPQFECSGLDNGLDPSWEKKVGENAINSVDMHPTEDVLLTACGERSFFNFDDPDQSNSFPSQAGGESTLKLWDMMAKTDIGS